MEKKSSLGNLFLSLVFSLFAYGFLASVITAVVVKTLRHLGVSI